MSEPTVKITIIPNGPALIETEKAQIKMVDGSSVEKEGRFSICRCGWSENKPFCDGKHTSCGFKG